MTDARTKAEQLAAEKDGTTAQFPMGTLTKQGGWWHGPRGSWGDRYIQAQYADYLEEREA